MRFQYRVACLRCFQCRVANLRRQSVPTTHGLKQIVTYWPVPFPTERHAALGAPAVCTSGTDAPRRLAVQIAPKFAVAGKAKTGP